MGTDNNIAEFFDKLEDVGSIQRSCPATRTQSQPEPGHVDLAFRPIDELSPLFANFLYIYFLTWLSHFQCFMVVLCILQ